MSRQDAAFFSPEMDAVLRNAVRSSTRRVRWDSIARLLPGVSAKACRARWEVIQPYGGLENMSFAAFQPIKRAPVVKDQSHSSKARLRRLDSATGRGGSSRGSTRGSSRTRGSSSTRGSSRTRGGAGASVSSGKRGGSAAGAKVDGRGSGGGGKAAGSADVQARDDTIVIHVCDEARGVNRDFHCGRRVLTNGMKYFRSYLSDSSSFEEIDISVHCDVHIFQWLMNYIKKPRARPELDIRNVISILISSDFLQMEGLVSHCLQHIKANVSAILKSPIDINCISSQLLVKLAQLFTPEEIDAIDDPKDKLMSKLFMRKLEALLHDPQNHLFECKHCGKLFTLEQHAWMRCPSSATTYINFHGEAIARHAPSVNWDVRKHIMNMRVAQKLRWRSIYWKLFARVNCLRCVECGQQFPLAELNHCSYHESDPVFAPGENEGRFECCRAKAFRFGVHSSPGCAARSHVPEAKTAHAKRCLDVLNKYGTLIALPFQQWIKQRAGEAADAAAEQTAEKRFKRYSAVQKAMSPSLKIPVKADNFDYTQVYADTGDGAESDYSDDMPASTRKKSSYMSSTPGRVPRLNGISRLGGIPRRKRRSSTKNTTATTVAAVPRKQWKMDRLIDEDRKRMGSLMSRLASLRTSVNPPRKRDDGSGSSRRGSSISRKGGRKSAAERRRTPLSGRGRNGGWK